MLVTIVTKQLSLNFSYHRVWVNSNLHTATV